MLPVPPLDHPVSATVRPPGSKSLTNRALVIAALAAPGSSRLHGPLEADDTMAMRRALAALGVLIDDNDDPWLVLGTGGELHAGDPIDAAASGTTARFITAVAGLAKGTAVVDGTARMRQRPIGPLTAALRALGVTVADSGGFPPVRVTGGRLSGGSVTVDSTLSSQFASALLMVAPLAEEPVQLRLGGPVASRPYLDGTVEMMGRFGAEVAVEDDVFSVAPVGYRKAHVQIESDASAAVYPAVAAAITGGRVRIVGIPAGSTQPDLAIFEVLAAMGCEVTHSGDVIAVSAGPGRLQAVDVDLSGAPDGAMAVAVAALFAGGKSRIRGLATLRVKETDRLTSLHTELSRLGAEVAIEDDSLVISPGKLRPARVETYDDHRMAMSLALVGLVVPGVEIVDPATVSKTWPGYFDMLSAL